MRYGILDILSTAGFNQKRYVYQFKGILVEDSSATQRPSETQKFILHSELRVVFLGGIRKPQALLNESFEITPPLTLQNI